MTRDELATRLLERAYLEGDFLLRSGRRSRYYLDKYRFETDPEILAGLGRELAALVHEHAPDAELLAGPELGAVPLAAVTLPAGPQGGQGVRHGQASGGCFRARAAGLRGRGCGHLGRRAAVRRGGAQGGKSRRFRCNLRR